MHLYVGVALCFSVYALVNGENLMFKWNVLNK